MSVARNLSISVAKYLSRLKDIPLLGRLDSLYVKRKEKHSEIFHVCVLLDEKYNSLDAIRPVLVWMKEHKECYITVVFLDCHAERDYVDLYPEKFAELKEYSDSIILNQSKMSTLYKIIKRFKLRHALEYLSSEETINTFLVAPDLFGDKRIVLLKDQFTKSLIVTTWYAAITARPLNNILDSYYPAPWYLDYLIVCNEIAAKNLYSDHINKVKVIRAPRLDRWWIQRQTSAEYIQKWKKELQKRHVRMVVCAIAAVSRREGRFTKHDKRMFREALEQLKQDATFIFKFHPRDTADYRREFVRQWVPDGVDWVESEYDLVQLIALGDIMVIAGITDSPGDVFFADIPVISFYDRHMQRHLDTSGMFEYHGGEETVYEHYDIVMHADNAKELVTLINDASLNSRWKEFSASFKYPLPVSQNASEEFAEVLLQRKDCI